MRTQLKLLAPVSILVTALYLAFLATQHSDSKPISVPNTFDKTSIIISQKAAHLAAKQFNKPKSKEILDTLESIRP